MNTEPNTTDLFNHLTSIRSESEFKTYLARHTSRSHSFSEYYSSLLNQKCIALTDAVKNSTLEKHYAYQIINGTKTNASRDKILCLCIGAAADLRETKHALEISKHVPLYARDMRDAIIIKHINLKDWSVLHINEELYFYQITPLLA